MSVYLKTNVLFSVLTHWLSLGKSLSSQLTKRILAGSLAYFLAWGPLWLVWHYMSLLLRVAMACLTPRTVWNLGLLILAQWWCGWEIKSAMQARSLGLCGPTWHCSRSRSSMYRYRPEIWAMMFFQFWILLCQVWCWGSNTVLWLFPALDLKQTITLCVVQPWC